MAMSLGGPERENDVLLDINTTPLIDVMLVLIIMLIITIPVQTHAVKIELPDGAPPTETVPPPVVAIAVDFDGTILWNQAVVPDRATLERYLTSAAAASPQPEIHLAADKLARYGSVAMVLAEAQRLGIVRIGIVGGAESMD